MCGSNQPLLPTRIEGSELKVCESCAKYGKQLQNSAQHRIPVSSHLDAPEQTIRTDFSRSIKQTRESLKLNQEDFAKKIQEKVSVVSHIESGKSEPSIALAKKLEKMFNIKLVEYEKESVNIPKSESGMGMTIGDVIKVRKANK